MTDTLAPASPDTEDLAIERVARVLAGKYTAPECRAYAEGCDLYLRIADAVEALSP